MANISKRPLKAFVRYDGTGRVISGSLILNRFKPAVGNWEEIDAYECCNPTTTTTSTTTGVPTTTTTSTTASPTTTTTTTLPVGVFAYSGGYSEVSFILACEDSTPITLYSSSPVFAENIFLFTDPGLTITPENGAWFSYGGSAYSLLTGEVVFSDPCG
jgi:hypothetical protein